MKTYKKIVLILIAVVLIIFIDSNYRIDTAEYELYSDRLPEAFDGFRIVQLSDTHATELGKDNRRLVSAIEKAQPDLIVITGDYIDDVGQLDFAEKLFTQLISIAPVYFVSGNHDWASGDSDALIKLMEKYDINYLDGKSELLTVGGESIRLIGVRDPAYPGMTKSVKRLAKEYGTQEYTIVFTHRNNTLSDCASAGVDTVLCGHAHGGIVRLPFTDGLVGPGRDLFPSFTSGLYSKGSTNMIVSRGLWLNIMTPRFLNNLHLPVIILRCG